MIIKLTEFDWYGEHQPVLIGTENVIRIQGNKTIEHYKMGLANVTQIESRGAMVTVTYVLESLDEIYKMCTNHSEES